MRKTFNKQQDKDYIIDYSFTGTGSFRTTAKNEDEAKENYHNGEGEYGDDDYNDYEITDISQDN